MSLPKHRLGLRPCSGDCSGLVTGHSKSGLCIHCFNKSAVGRKRSDAFRIGQSKNALKQFAQDPEQRQTRSRRMWQSWFMGNITPKSRKSSPKSKSEQRFVDALREISPYDIQQHRTIRLPNGSWLIPDIFIPRLNLVIEFYGDYWHANPENFSVSDKIKGQYAIDIWMRDSDREERIRLFHDLRIVWQSEAREFLTRLDQLWNWECDPASVAV